MVSLKAKNPFGSDIEMLNLGTWLGIGAFVVLLGVILLGVNFVVAHAGRVTSPIEGLWSEINR